MELSSEEAEIPMPINSIYGGGMRGHGHGHHGYMTHDHHHHQTYHQRENHPHPPSSSSSPQSHHHHQIIPQSSNINPNNNGTDSTTTTTPALDLEDDQQEVPYSNTESALKNNKVIRIRYRECKKNHAASMGGNATDGCGEFMPSGEEGTLQFLTCSVCNCHRNFHRREIEGCDGGGGNECPPLAPPLHHSFNYHPTPHHIRGRKVIFGGTTTSNGGQGLLGYPTGVGASVSLIPAGSRAVAFNLHYPHYQVGCSGGGARSALDDQSDDQNDHPAGAGSASHQMVKKRFRTKFSQEQKEKMLEFAEKVGWKIQKQEEVVVQKFCQEVGVKRRVLKVWMHNNKHTFAKKNLPDDTDN